MRWVNRSHLYSCDGLHSKLNSHAANPLPLHLKDDIYRIYFSARDSRNRSSVGAVDFDIVERRLVKEHRTPFFTYGPSDSFYSHGVSIGNAYQVGSTWYMLFMGWQQPKGEHWFGEIGRLIVNSDFSLSLDSNEPFFGLDKEDPISLSYPWVEKLGDQYQMWYGSTIEWDVGNDEMLHIIKSATSEDGHTWRKTGKAIPYSIGHAQAFSRPTVLAQKDMPLTMLFSYRSGDGSSYKIGSSVCAPDSKWQEVKDVSSLSAASKGWDSQMQEYPFVWQHKDQVHILYNGNDFGKSGFGIATLSPD